MHEVELPLSSSHGVWSYEATSNVLVFWFGNSVMVDGLIGGCETEKVGLERGRGWGRWFARWGWDWQLLVVVKQKYEICGDRWIERLDGYDLVLMGWSIFIFYLFFSYGFDRFNLRLVASVLILVSLFWSSVLIGLLGFKNMNNHVLGRTWTITVFLSSCVIWVHVLMYSCSNLDLCIFMFF